MMEREYDWPTASNLKLPGVNKIPTIDFNYSALTLHGLETVLRMLNEEGELWIRNVRPGSVKLLELGATLAAIAQEAKSDTHSP